MVLSTTNGFIINSIDVVVFRDDSKKHENKNHYITAISIQGTIEGVILESSKLIIPLPKGPAPVLNVIPDSVFYKFWPKELNGSGWESIETVSTYANLKRQFPSGLALAAKDYADNQFIVLTPKYNGSFGGAIMYDYYADHAIIPVNGATSGVILNEPLLSLRLQSGGDVHFTNDCEDNCVNFENIFKVPITQQVYFKTGVVTFDIITSSKTASKPTKPLNVQRLTFIIIMVIVLIVIIGLAFQARKIYRLNFKPKK